MSIAIKINNIKEYIIMIWHLDKNWHVSYRTDDRKKYFVGQNLFGELEE